MAAVLVVEPSPWAVTVAVLVLPKLRSLLRRARHLTFTLAVVVVAVLLVAAAVVCFPAAAAEAAGALKSQDLAPL